MGRTWGRLYSGTRNHHKIRALRRKHPRYWKAIYPLMEMSFEADADGNIQIAPGEPYSMKDLAQEVDEPLPKLIKLLQDMVNFGLISLQENVPKFLSYNERQFNSDADGAERTRRWRSKKGEIVTSQGRHGDGVCDGPEAEAEAELDKTPLPPLKKGGESRSRNNGKIPYDAVKEAWNKFAPPLLPRIISINNTRKGIIKQAWIEKPNVEWFQSFFQDINLSDHHSGKNDRNWTPDIEWILKNRIKLQEKIVAVKSRQNLPGKMDDYLNYLGQRDGVKSES